VGCHLWVCTESDTTEALSSSSSIVDPEYLFTGKKKKEQDSKHITEENVVVKAKKLHF